MRACVCVRVCGYSLGDTGAHLSSIIDAGYTSWVLSHWVKQRGFFSLVEAVRRMTSAPATAAGIPGRGLLRPSYRADINVIDLEAVAEGMPYVAHDLPWAGNNRLMQHSEGYEATIVNGVVVVRHGVLTGRRAGHVLRRCEPVSRAPPGRPPALGSHPVPEDPEAVQPRL